MMNRNFIRKNISSLIRPSQLITEIENSKYGKFELKPLERGFGLTLGNSLRRILLSSVQGTGLIAIKLEGVDHEFGALQHVKEEVAEIILNLKTILFHLKNQDECTLKIEKKGEGILLASDIQLNEDVVILNPEQVIAHLSSKASFSMELKLKKGIGYVTHLENKERLVLPVGWIYVDTLFSPVHKVNYSIFNSRVGKRTDYDRLVLEIWTNGTLLPSDALAVSGKILKDQLSVFLGDYEDDLPSVERFDKAKEGPSVEILNKLVSELELSVRSANCLEKAGINYIHQLVSRQESEMLRTKNFGRKSLNEIKDLLFKMGLGFGMKIQDKEKIV